MGTCRKYLSVDLDWFNGKPELSYIKYMKRLLNSKVPLAVFLSHEEQVAYLPEEFDVLINMDEHPDLCHIIERDIPKLGTASNTFSRYIVIKELNPEIPHDYYQYPANLHCGNWVNFCFLPGRKYVWIPPEKDSLSFLCSEYLFSKKKEHLRNWQDVSIQRKLPNPKEMIGIGLCLSVDYVHEKVGEMFFSEFYPLFLEKKNVTVSKWLTLAYEDWKTSENFLWGYDGYD